MPFVKLDCGILNSTIWTDSDARIAFITALLMAEPREYTKPVEQLAIREIQPTGWNAPPGWYGFVAAASTGILANAGVPREAGLAALERLGSPDPESRSPEYEGRRLIRVNGGFLVLNYQKYRDRDYTAAERQRRYRKRQQESAQRRLLDDDSREDDCDDRDVTPSHNASRSREQRREVEQEDLRTKDTAAGAAVVRGRAKKAARNEPYTDDFEAFWQAWPEQSRVGKREAFTSWLVLLEEAPGFPVTVMAALLAQTAPGAQLDAHKPLNPATGRSGLPMPATWLNNRRFEDGVVGVAAAQRKPSPFAGLGRSIGP